MHNSTTQTKWVYLDTSYTLSATLVAEWHNIPAVLGNRPKRRRKRPGLGNWYLVLWLTIAAATNDDGVPDPPEL
jgi:hypothetical protein